MSTFSIRVDQRSLGLGLIVKCIVDVHNGVNDQVIISELAPNSKAQKLGLSVGDILIEINGQKVTDSDLYYYQQIPFQAKFKREQTNVSDFKKPKKTNQMKAVTHQQIPKPKLSQFIVPGLASANAKSPTFALCRLFNHNRSIYCVTSRSLSPGIHEYAFKILQCSTDRVRQEIGVVSTCDVNSLSRVGDQANITAAKAFGARAILCNDAASKTIYYASYNADGSPRIHRPLSDTKDEQYKQWKVGDIIGVSINLDQWKIIFSINSKKVRKAISLEPRKPYFPLIAFSGHCRYQLM